MDGVHRENMSRLLENQAGQLLREANSVGTGGGLGARSGDLQGFTNIAFPIVRRVFGGLVANELVSIQPMSLPSGLLFYLDYTYGSRESYTSNSAISDKVEVYASGSSIYNNPSGKGIRSGSLGTGGLYDLAGSGFTKVHSGSALGQGGSRVLGKLLASGSVGSDGDSVINDGGLLVATGTDGKLLQFDPQVTNLIEADPGQSNTGRFQAAFFDLGSSAFANFDLTQAKEWALNLNAILPGAASTNDQGAGVGAVPESMQGGQNIVNVRRLNQLGTFTANVFTADPMVQKSTANACFMAIVTGSVMQGSQQSLFVSAPISTTLDVDGDGSTLTIPSFESNFGNTPSPVIPEIDIKIESIAVTAATRKLRARWSPELAQDLNAYHSLDAEVELTQILSEQIALEIDREVLNDLLTQAKTTRYWSRAPGKFVNRETGAEVSRSDTLAPGPAFTGTVREWYETLTETIIDVANEIHRLTLRGSANFIVVSPDVATVLEASVLYRPAYTLDGEGQVSQPMSLGAEKIGTLSNRFTVYKDPYFPRNKVLVGYKGGSYLETGYVYAPYVPLIVTPTIFQPDDFTPRKGVMTRYGKKMVRSDFYGTVTCLDMNII
tara:strand:+ start:5724 stop:7547 length:1824 start_codon:yes stop_codon:yes gene_type:complete